MRNRQRTTSLTKSHSPARRGVASVLAMMFMVLFGSLAAAMAVVAQSNMRTADSGLKLSRAMSAAETGLVLARRRLAEQANRFVVEKGVIDGDYGAELWLGTYDEGADGPVIVMPPVGFIETTPPEGLVHAMLNAHSVESHYVDAGAQPQISDVFGTLSVPAIALTSEPESAYFKLTYELLQNAPYVRVTSEGHDGDIRRTLSMDFRIDKRIEFAVLSPNRIMIGKNVLIDGPLGSRYGLVAGELDSANGDPLVMRSDFYYLHPTVTQNLDILFAKVAEYDIDGDGRLRPDHPAEAAGLAGTDLADYNGDEYVDDFDLFMEQFDTSPSDQRVVYDAERADQAGLGNLAEEFAGIDDQLGRLIDEAMPDRNSDGKIDSRDTMLGYKDGVLDLNDLYAKVRGRLAFAVEREPWDTANGGPYQDVVYGPIIAEADVAPAKFEVTEDEMREITTAMFTNSQTWFHTQTNTSSSDFADQVAAGVAAGGTVVAAVDAPWEDVPYGSLGAYDHYQRPIYRDMTFTNVRIPQGTNALFENCKFVGVTYIETHSDTPEQNDFNWNLSGAMKQVMIETPPGSGNYVASYQLAYSTLAVPPPVVDGSPVPDTRTLSNNIRFHECTFLGSIAGDKPFEYTHWRNKIQMTGNTRFYIDAEDTDLANQDDASDLITLLGTLSDDDIEELEKSSILLPGWSVDVGNFNNEQDADPTLTPKIKLKGTIIAGIMDIRGTADVHGTLLMTFRPTAGQGPLHYGGLLDSFNTTIGYFGPEAGDGEGSDPNSAGFNGFGEITLRYNPTAKLPDGIPWPICVDADPTTYVE